MKKLLAIIVLGLSMNAAFAQDCNSKPLEGSICKIDFKVTMEELNKSIVVLQNNIDQSASKETICSTIDDMRLRATAVRDIFLNEKGSCYDAVRIEDDVLYKAKFNTVVSRTTDMRAYCGSGLYRSLTAVEPGNIEALKSALRTYQRSLANLQSYVANGSQAVQE